MDYTLHCSAPPPTPTAMLKRKRSKSATRYFCARFPPQSRPSSPPSTSSVSDSAAPDSPKLVPPSRASFASCSKENTSHMDFASGNSSSSLSPDPARANNQLSGSFVPTNQPLNIHISGSTLTVVEGNMHVYNYMDAGAYLRTCIVIP